jgi:mRNA degradation ribonuclease J1/J2
MSLGNERLHQRMVENGFTMLVRDNGKFRKWLDHLMLMLDPEETVLIYSQYKGYLKEQPRLQEFVSLYGKNMAYVHTSGHATRKALEKICRIVNPSTAIIPIHRDPTSDFMTLDISDELKQKITESSICRNGIEILID